MSGVLADTSVWVRHFRRSDAVLQSLLTQDRILCHPLVVIELSCGTPPAPRKRTLADIRALRQATVATTEEVLAFIETHALHDTGCGAIDVMLLASAVLTPRASIWTDDRSLHAQAVRLGVAYSPVRR